MGSFELMNVRKLEMAWRARPVSYFLIFRISEFDWAK